MFRPIVIFRRSKAKEVYVHKVAEHIGRFWAIFCYVGFFDIWSGNPIKLSVGTAFVLRVALHSSPKIFFVVEWSSGGAERKPIREKAITCKRLPDRTERDVEDEHQCNPARHSFRRNRKIRGRSECPGLDWSLCLCFVCDAAISTLCLRAKTFSTIGKKWTKSM